MTFSIWAKGQFARRRGNLSTITINDDDDDEKDPTDAWWLPTSSSKLHFHATFQLTCRCTFCSLILKQLLSRVYHSFTLLSISLLTHLLHDCTDGCFFLHLLRWRHFCLCLVTTSSPDRFTKWLRQVATPLLLLQSTTEKRSVHSLFVKPNNESAIAKKSNTQAKNATAEQQRGEQMRIGFE